MTKLGNKVSKTIFVISAFSVLFMALYGIGRFLHFFPPVDAFRQLGRIYKIEKNTGEKNMDYSIALDKLADIYYEHDYEKWGTGKREEAIKTFTKYNFQNTDEYATSLFKFSEYLLSEESGKYRATALLCRDCYLNLYNQKKITDDSRRNLVKIFISTFDFEISLVKKIQLVRIAMDVNSSFINETKEDIRSRILLFAALGMYHTEDYSFWIESQNNFEQALDLSQDREYLVENTLSKILFARLLVKMQNYEYAKDLLDSCDKEIINKANLQITYKKILADVLRGLGLDKEAQNEMNKIETLNFEKTPNIQFLTFYQKAQDNILQGNTLLSFYYLHRVKWLIRKPEINDDQHLLKYYYLELLYSLRFKSSNANLWKAKIEKNNFADNQNIIGLLFAETQIERLSKSAAYFNKASVLFVNIQKSVSAHFKYLTENQRVNYWRQYERAIPMLYEAGYYSKDKPEIGKACFDAALFSKGIILGSSIEFSKLLTESGDTNLLLNYYQLLDVRQQITTKLEQKKNVNTLNQLAEKLERNLVQKSHEFGDYTNKMLIKWENVQVSMQKNDVAIEFIDFPISSDSTIYAALILRKEWSQPKMIKLFEGRQLSSIINNSSKWNYSSALEMKISDLVWQKILPFIKHKDNIYFAPTNLLHIIAIESLPLHDSVRMNEEFNMNRVSSTKQLCIQRNNKQDNKGVTSCILYGGLKYSLDNNELIQESSNYKTKVRGEQYNPGTFATWKELPKTKEEVDAISHLLTSKKIKSVLYTGKKGNEESFKNLSGSGYSIIHVATHGFYYTNDKAKKNKVFDMGNSSFQEDNSLSRSGLILAGANRAWNGKLLPRKVEDGILTAQEVSALNLRKTELVVLSACETGLGEITSEGVFGLQRGFKKAGVQTLLMSLWKVNDEATSVFMTSFYGHLFNGDNKRAAFIKAQQTVKSISKYKSPYYWSGFVLLD